MHNHLQNETSPYLLQHADNPVDWFPWNEVSLRRAAEENKPILLSIGYSACHWCHVMAHESFEDPATAALMNELFVNIKVDREERPDIDKIYQLAHQLTTGRPGGWPLTAFLDPDSHLPIFAGTYFPNEARYGMPAFKDVLQRVASFYRENRDDVAEHGRALTQAFDRLQPAAEDASLSLKPLAAARARLAESFDPQHGGFGTAPKFPHPTFLELLLAYWRSTAEEAEPDLDALQMVALSLMRMAEGGLYDQIGGGFFRYCVDREWQIPHFEKMLYDNGALLALYSQAHAATGEEFFARIAAETAGWATAEMQGDSGGYFSTLDADSEGREGGYYVWTRSELRALLSEEERAVAESHYGFDLPPNFGKEFWHLRVVRPIESVADEQQLSRQAAEDSLRSARKKLLAGRSQRVRPARDEKILASWNGLMIKGMAIAARRLERVELAQAATRAVDLVRSRLWHEGRLRATYKDGRARLPAYLDDYAFLADALLELLQVRWRSSDLDLACALLDVLLEQFEDPRGGFFFTANEHETLVHRSKSFADEAVPSGNGVAVTALIRVGHLLGEDRYLRAAERALKASWPLLEGFPEAHASMLLALQAFLEPPDSIIVRGPAAQLDAWRRFVNAGYHPHRLAFCIPDDETELPGLLAERRARDQVVAYVCRGTQCRAPLDSLEGLAGELGAGS